MTNVGKQFKQFTQFYQGTGFGKQTTVGFYTQKIHDSLLWRRLFASPKNEYTVIHNA